MLAVEQEVLIVTVITGDEARVLKNMFIDRFVDKQSSWYHALLKQLQESQGKHYHGCLWDSLFRANLRVVPMDYVANHLRQYESVYLFWDNHPEICFTWRNPHWSYPKNCLLRLSFSQWEEMKDLLPEDCYLFDETLTWAVALTHEESSPGCRVCYYLMQ